MNYPSLFKLANYFYSLANKSDSPSYPNYPKDYHPGKKYGREELAKIFSQLTGFPFLACKEAFFPLLPGGKELLMDPKAMQIYGPEPITIEEFAAKEKEKYSSWSMGIVTLSMDNLSDETLQFIKLKQKAPGYQERIDFQKNKVLKNKKNTLSITPPNEPVILTEKNNKYSIKEGWHRILTLLEMLQSGELGDKESVKVRAIVGHQN